MAVAPLSQTIQLTEDGSSFLLTASVTIPPDIINATVENTLGSSELLGSAVSGFVILTNLLDDRLVTVGA